MRLERARGLLGASKVPRRARTAKEAEFSVRFDQRGLAKSGRLEPLPKRLSRSAARVPPALGDKRLDAALADLHRLHAISAVRAREGGLSFVFESPVPWPHFLRLDLAKPFAPAAAELCRSLAGLSVESVSLARENMEVRVV